MSSLSFRHSLPGDELALRQIWTRSFDDTNDFLEDFFSNIYRPGSALIAEYCGTPVSAFHIIPDCELISPDHPVLPCPYLYSLGTLPEFRGKGIGSAIVRETIRTALNEKNGIACIYPAQDSLYSWYEICSDAKPAFFVKEIRFKTPPEIGGHIKLCPISSAEYYRLREFFLDGHDHISFPIRLIEWQERLCNNSDGGLFAIESGNGLIGCAAAGYFDGVCFVKEFISPASEALGCLSFFPPSKRQGGFVVRAPSFFVSSEAWVKRRFVIASGLPSSGDFPSDEAYWGFVFE